MLITTSDGSNKRKWAFAAGGTPEDSDKLRVHCGTTEAVEVSSGMV